MRILVTGGAGYKGVILCKRLLDAGHQVTVLDNFIYGFDPIIHLLQYDELDVLKVDVRNLEASHLEGADAVIHLAGLSGYPACEANPHSAKLINVDACRRLAELLNPDQRVIYASTTSLYGANGAVCDEDAHVEPTSLYAITKYEGERVLLQRPNTVSLRFATIFGVSPRMRVDVLVNDFAFRAAKERCIVLFESRSKRTFLHIQDAVDAYMLTLEKFDQMAGKIYNVGHESLNFSKRHIADTIKDETGCTIIDSEMKDFDPRDFEISFARLRGLGFQPKCTLEDGVKELAKLYRFYAPYSHFATI